MLKTRHYECSRSHIVQAAMRQALIVIDLQPFANKSVILTNINTMTHGFGTKNNPGAGGTGTTCV